MQTSHTNQSPALTLATLFGLGKSPFAPGTVATIVMGIPCFLLAGRFSCLFQTLIAALIFALGWYTSDKAADELNNPDPGEVVIDELCGYLVAMIGHPVSFVSVLTGFILFRLFDIWKPWPLRLIEEKLKGGLGIMADDVGAGIYANAAGFVILKLLHSL